MFEGIDPTMALLLAETQAIPEYPVTPDAGLQYLQSSDLDILTGEPTPSGEDIIINGYRYWWTSGSSGSGGGGGGNNSNTNEQEGGLPQSAAMQYEFDNTCVKLVALEVVDDIFNAAKLTGYEYGVTLISNGNGTFGAFRDAIITNFSTTSVNFDAPRDGTVVGFVHNHPWQKSATTDPYINQRSEYPSGPDWEQAEKLVAEGGVSDTSNFSLFIIDVNGVIREFKYKDKAYYQSLSLSDKYAKVGLPTALTPCTAAP